MAISKRNKKIHISLLLATGFLALVLSVIFYNIGHSESFQGILAGIPSMDASENSTSTLNNEFLVEVIKTLCEKVVSII